METSNNLLDGVDFESSNRSRISVSLLHLSIEHQKGIHVLIDSNVNGSAFALLRPQFETYVRGLWLNRCATDIEIEKFIVGKEPPRINELIIPIEKTHGFTQGALMRQKEQLWKILNDYTHGGSIQAKSRITSNEIIGNYKDEHLLWLLKKSATFSCLAGIEIAGIANNIEVDKQLLTTYKKIYASAP